MEQVTTIGLDIAKHVFQAHGADASGHVLFRKRITRMKLIGFFAAQKPAAENIVKDIFEKYTPYGEAQNG